MNLKVETKSTIQDALEVINSSHLLLAVMLDENGILMGTITDGDVRRALLNGNTLSSSAANCINPHPVVSVDGEPVDLKSIDPQIRGVPVVDEQGKFIRVASIDDFLDDKIHARYFESVAAVIMAGGKGERLRPYTMTKPKPMVTIDRVPLIERQVKDFIAAGIRKIYISVNYLSHVIIEHFEKKPKLLRYIHFLEETSQLGTAGALSLIRNDFPEKQLLVINGDVLTKCNYGSLLDFHSTTQAHISVAAVAYSVNIPYGVFETHGHWAHELNEKPSKNYLCNAGIYVLDRQVVKEMMPSQFIDMTQLVEKYMHVNKGVSIFPIYEYWSDIGTPTDLKKARSEVRKLPARDKPLDF